MQGKERFHLQMLKKKIKERIRNKHNQNVQDLYKGNLNILLRKTNEDLSKYLE